MKAPPGKWLVHCASHDGTRAGVIEYPPTTHDSRKDARKASRGIIAGYTSQGRHTLFARLYDDQGQEYSLGVPVPITYY